MVLPVSPRRRGRRPRVPLAKVLPGLVFHFINAPARSPNISPNSSTTPPAQQFVK